MVQEQQQLQQQQQSYRDALPSSSSLSDDLDNKQDVLPYSTNSLSSQSSSLPKLTSVQAVSSTSRDQTEVVKVFKQVHTKVVPGRKNTKKDLL